MEIKSAASCEKIVEEALVSLTLDYPIYAQLMMRIGVKVVEYKDRRFKAWTDGTAIFINKYIIDRCNRYPLRLLPDGTQVNVGVGVKEMMFILSHELMHLLGLSWERGDNKGIAMQYGAGITKAVKHQIQNWNKATDYEINSLLHNNEDENGYSKPVGNMPEDVLYESKYRNKIAEDIYDDIVAKEKADKQQQSQSNGGGFGGNNPIPSNSNSDGDNNPNDDDEDNSSFTDEEPEGIDYEFDEHMPLKDETTKNELIAKIGETTGGKDIGTGSSAIDRLLAKTFKEQPFNWRRALAKYIRGWMKENYTWNKPSRAGIANNIILPSQGRTPKMHVAVAIDTSGSVTDNELQQLLNHLFTILQMYKDFQVDVWCVSTRVHEDTFGTFTAKNKSKLSEYMTQSDGGTNLRTCFEFIDEKYKIKKPDVFILMSDFYDSLDGDTETSVGYPCIWMVINHKSFTPPTKIKAETYHITLDGNGI